MSSDLEEEYWARNRKPWVLSEVSWWLKSKLGQVPSSSGTYFVGNNRELKKIFGFLSLKFCADYYLQRSTELSQDVV